MEPKMNNDQYFRIWTGVWFIAAYLMIHDGYGPYTMFFMLVLFGILIPKTLSIMFDWITK